MKRLGVDGQVDAGVEDGKHDAAGRRLDRLDRARHAGLVGDVAGKRQDAARQAGGGGHHLVERILRAGGDGHGVAFARKVERQGPADAGAAAREPGDAVLGIGPVDCHPRIPVASSRPSLTMQPANAIYRVGAVAWNGSAYMRPDGQIRPLKAAAAVSRVVLRQEGTNSMHRSVIDVIGNTPLIRLKRASEETGCEILGKAEFMNPGQSVKDRAGLFIIRDAEAQGPAAGRAASSSRARPAIPASA